MIRTLVPAAFALLAVATPALAQEEPAASIASEPPAAAGWGTWSFLAGAATDNRSKDASKSGGDPFAFVAAEWESADGRFYFGPGAETIKSSGSELEVELGGGFRPQVAGFDFDLNATHKWRLDSNPGVDDDAWEFTADMRRSIGPASGRVRLQHSPDGTGSTEAWTWYEARVGWDFTSRLQGTAAIGRREQDNSVDYTGWNAGVTYAFTDALEGEMRYHATDAEEFGEQYEDALVAGLSVAF